MRGVRFYLEYNKTKGKRELNPKNVLAVLVGNGRSSDDLMYDVIAPAFHKVKNSDVVSTTASVEYIRHYCRRISEKKARSIHPKLFLRLDS